MPTKRIIIIHRWSGGPSDDWRPWIAHALGVQDCTVIVPEMPDMDKPRIATWTGQLAKLVGAPDTNTYFIGHSIGCQAILRYLETVPDESPQAKAGGAVFVAGWFNLKNLEDAETEEIAKPWIETPINTLKVKHALPKSTLLISGNDPYDCLEENIKKFKEIGSKIITVPNAGHFTSEDGFIEFPQLLDVVQNMIA